MSHALPLPSAPHAYPVTFLTCLAPASNAQAPPTMRISSANHAQISVKSAPKKHALSALPAMESQTKSVSHAQASSYQVGSIANGAKK